LTFVEVVVIKLEIGLAFT